MPGAVDSLTFHPEGEEDLSMQDDVGQVVEVIQVKSNASLALSDLSPANSDSFFHRVLRHLRNTQPPVIRLVTFGSIGPEMQQAWAGESKARTQVATKLASSGFDESDVELLFQRVKLEELNEADVHDGVISHLRNGATGIDPETAFELFYYWLALLSETQRSITQSDIITRLNGIGTFLSSRATYHRQWGTSIRPLEDRPINEDRQAELRNEFYRGIQARYEHIRANLDFRREDKLAEISGAFERTRVVILHAASGQGKSALAYRFLQTAYPNTWRYAVGVGDNRLDALEIATALKGFADSIQAPLIVYVDVSIRDTSWVELVRELAYHDHLQVLVTIREEDLRRATLSGAEFDYSLVELTFDEAEARLIFERARQAGEGLSFLDFDEAWNRFGGRGPLLEFVYLLTQTTTLRESLQQQVTRIIDEISTLDRHTDRPQRHPDELKLLRLVSVASAYEARLRTSSLVARLSLPVPERTLDLFEKSYLLRRTAEGYLEGFHPVRSRILVDLLTSADITPWVGVASEALPAMIEEDIEGFVLHALVEHFTEQEHLLNFVCHLRPASWAGLAGVFRSLCWAGVREYIELNRPIIEAARAEFGRGWSMLLDLDFTGISSNQLQSVWERLGQLFPPERAKKFEELRARQTPKERALKPASDWLAQLDKQPQPPSSSPDWLAVAELCFWSGYFEIAPHLEQSLSDEELSWAAENLSLASLAQVSLGLYVCNRDRHKEWVQSNLGVIQTRLAVERQIVALEEQGQTLKVHFLTADLGDTAENTEMASAPEQRSKGRLNDAAVERIELVRMLFPTYGAYGSQGYGHRLGLELPTDDSYKSGIPISYFDPIWTIRLNAIGRGLADYAVRPNTWLDYVTQIIETRELVLTCLEQLKRGLIKFLQRRKPIKIYEDYVNLALWLQCIGSVGASPPLPKSVVDPWGFAQEGLSKQYAESDERAGRTFSRVLLRSLTLPKYASYLEAERDYSGYLTAFFQNTWHIIVNPDFLRQLHDSDRAEWQIAEKLQNMGSWIDIARRNVRTLFDAKHRLQAHQQQFRRLFEGLVNTEGLRGLEAKEREILNEVWRLWYFFAHAPWQMWSQPRIQTANQVRFAKRELERRVQEAINAASVDDTAIEFLPINKDWLDTPALIVRLDIEDPLTFNDRPDKLILALRERISRVDFQSLESYVVEEEWVHVVLIPRVRGKLLNRSVWRLHTLSTIRSIRNQESAFWLYMPTEVPETVLDEWGLDVWDIDEIVMAIDFSSAVRDTWLLVAQLGELAAVPEPTESGAGTVEAFIERQSGLLNQRLQAAIDAMVRMVNAFNALSPEAQDERERLKEATGWLAHIYELLVPYGEFSGNQSLPVSGLADYALRLEQAQRVAEWIGLLWIADALDRLATSES